MGQVHQLIEHGGKKAALQADVDRKVVEAASQFMSDEEAGIGFLYSGWCQAALPHRRLPDGQSWQIHSDRISLIVEPGSKLGPDGRSFVPSGVAYGSRARLIFLYLQSTAIRTKSREIELGGSLREWLQRMGIPQGGKSQRDVRDQAERISRCRFTFHVQQGNGKVGLVNQNVVDTALFVPSSDANEKQGSLFVETARLSEVFFDLLQRHPVPVQEAAIKAINNNSVALDIYAWLAYRLHVLNKPTPVSWSALKAQFGNGVTRMDNFRVTFLDNLKLSLAVYPDAKVDVEERGLVLHPSHPPVPERALR